MEWLVLWHAVQGWRWLLIGVELTGSPACAAAAVEQGCEMVRLLVHTFFTATTSALGAWKAAEMVVEAWNTSSAQLSGEAQGWQGFFKAWALHAKLRELVEAGEAECRALVDRASKASEHVKAADKTALRKARDDAVALWVGQRIVPCAGELLAAVEHVLLVDQHRFLWDQAALRHECMPPLVLTAAASALDAARMAEALLLEVKQPVSAVSALHRRVLHVAGPLAKAPGLMGKTHSAAFLDLCERAGRQLIRVEGAAPVFL